MSVKTLVGSGSGLKLSKRVRIRIRNKARVWTRGNTSAAPSVPCSG